MSLAEIVLLAIVQGVAEFLPISSSGHLVVVSELLGTGGASTEVNVMLHAGTLLSILVYFRRRVVRLLGEDRRVIWLLLIGTLPAAALGLTLRALYPTLLESPLLAGWMLIVTGLLLLGSRRLPEGVEKYPRTTASKSFAVGLFQALALLPGISRSGATIFGGLLLGLRRESAATFSFLLAIPAIAGATTLELVHFVGGEMSGTTPGALALGCLIAFGVGLLSLEWLFRWLENGKLHYFAFWCLPLGAAVVAWQSAG